MSGALPQLHERRRKTQKLFSSPRKRRPTLMSHEQWSAELPLKDANSCADRRLTDVQSVSGLDETSRRDDLKKGPGKLSVHAHTSVKMHLSISRIRFCNASPR